MQQGMDNPRKNSSPILPLVVAAFAGATLAIACERPDPRAVAQEYAAVSSPPAAAPAPPPSSQATAPAAPAAPAPVAGTTSTPETAISDTIITARIKASLLGDPALAGSDIAVNTDRGVVNLVGSVTTHEQTGIASAHAQRQEGVMRVDSHLTVPTQ